MGQVNGIGGETKVLPQKKEEVVTKNETRQVQVFNQEIKEEPKLKTLLNSYELDYSTFKSKDRADANKFAARSINEVKDLARDFNIDFPRNPYLVDYDTFPKPEQFAQFKKEAYDSWKEAVKEWVEDHKQGMVAQKSTNLNDLNNSINEKIDRQTLDLYMRMGYTEAFINYCFQMAKGDLNQLAKIIRQEAAKTRATVEQNADEVIEVVKQEGESTRTFVEEDNVKTRRLVYNESQENKINTSINHAVTRGTVNQRAKETQEINALSNAISNLTSRSLRTDETVSKIENKKQRIIKGNLPHEQKIQKLTKLRELVANSYIITDKDLNGI